MEKQPKKHKLAVKFIIGFVLLGVLLSVGTSLAGFYQYKGSIEKQYNNDAYDIASVAASYFTPEQLALYKDVAEQVYYGKMTPDEAMAIQQTDEYQAILIQMKKLRENVGANDIFIVTVEQDVMKSFDPNWSEEQQKNWKPVVYLMDCYTVDEQCFNLGNAGGFNPEYIEDTIQIFTTGERTDNYFLSKSFGYNTTAMLPVKLNGEVAVAVGVEIPMSTIESALKNYLILVTTITTIIVLVAIFVYLAYLYRTMIMPINQVTKAANDFIDNGNRVSDSLSEIRTKDEIQTLAGSILKMEKDINEYIRNLTAVTAEKERIGAELDVARNIQASMLPCIFPPFPERSDFDIYATMNPAKEVGGDFYDFFMVDDRHLAIVMADVSGKGVPAALFMVIGKTLLKDHTQINRDLGEVFSEVNNLLCEANSEELFITAFEGVLDLATGEFRFVNAGHEMPFICRKGEGYAPYKIRPGFVLAGMEGMRYQSGVLNLQPGDKLFQYTDGVTEATNSQNELYGMERLNAVLNRCTESTPEETLKAVKADIDLFVGEAPQFDDITMLCVDYKKKLEE